VYAARRVASVGAFTGFVVEFSTISHNSFSCNSKIVLSFQAPKFIALSSLSLTFKPIAIDPFLLKMKNSKFFPLK
jgi:hypothetical protein